MAVSTMECGGVIAILQQDGVDTQTLYLFDPSTKACVEVAKGANGQNDCVASVSGVPLATSCTFAVANDGFNDTNGFAFRRACVPDGGVAAGADGAAEAAGDM